MQIWFLELENSTRYNISRMRWKKTSTNMFYTSPFPINQCWIPLATSGRTHWCHSTLCGGEGWQLYSVVPQSVPTLFSRIVASLYMKQSPCLKEGSFIFYIFWTDFYIFGQIFAIEIVAKCCICQGLNLGHQIGSRGILYTTRPPRRSTQDQVFHPLKYLCIIITSCDRSPLPNLQAWMWANCGILSKLLAR